MDLASAQLDELATTLVKARAALGITQNELHKRTGISREAIKGYESGRNKPGARELRLLCEVLQVTPNVLLFGSENPFEPRTGLVNFVQETGQLDWAKLFGLFTLLTMREKESILFLIESILLGRHSQEEIRRRLGGLEFASAVMATMLQNAKKIEAGDLKPEEVDIAKDIEQAAQLVVKRQQAKK